MIKQYFFWEYDIFPYVLGGIGSMNNDGSFTVDSYGNLRFPRKGLIAVYPVEMGKKIHETIKANAAKAESEAKQARKLAEIEIAMVMPEYANRKYK